MDDALVVQLDLIGFAAGQQQILAISKAIANITQPMNAANRAVQQHSRAVAQASGPWQRLIVAQQKYYAALKSGNQVAIFDAAHNMNQAGVAYNRALQKQQGGPGLSQVLKNAIFSTRFGVGQGGFQIMPLIGRTMQALASLGPMGVAAGVAAAAISAMAVAVQHVTSMLTAFAKAFWTGGGTPGEMGRAAGIGSALGMSAGDMASGARQFQQRIQPGGDPIAQMAAAGMGLRENIHGFEKLDAMTQYLAAIKAVVMDPNQNNAMRNARRLGLEEYLPLRDLDKSDKAGLFGGAGGMGDMFSPEKRRDAAKFNLEMGRLNMIFQQFMVTAISPTVEALLPLLQIMGDLAPVIKVLAQLFAYLISPFVYLFNIVKQALQMLGIIGKGPADPHKDALKENTDALNGNTQAMQGMYGGGERAKGFIPAGYQFNPDPAAQGALRQSISLGAFAL